MVFFVVSVLTLLQIIHDPKVRFNRLLARYFAFDSIAVLDVAQKPSGLPVNEHVLDTIQDFHICVETSGYQPTNSLYFLRIHSNPHFGLLLPRP
jgi:hypothetical protein